MSATTTVYTYALYIWQNFSFGEKWIGMTCCMFCIGIRMIELNLEKQIENKLEVVSNRKNTTCNAIQLQLVVTYLAEVKILSCTHR
jgi:hypothetical protein